MMCGAEPAAWTAALPMLNAIGATVHHMGWGELNATAVFKVFEVMAGMAPDASAARAAG